MATETNESVEALLEHIRSSRGFDFTGYKRTSLERRITKRMSAAGVDNYADYRDYLEVHQDEFAQLFDTILINVTMFFRDPTAWEYLTKVAIPKIELAHGGAGLIRVWSAGCASGEEAYTAAVVFGEVLGIDALEERVKIYATDVDEDALATARHGVFSSKQLEPIPAALHEKYFDEVGSRFSFKKNLRRSVIFGRHDLVQDAPISRLDLLICRNTLMYFNAELQNRILRNFHFALTDHGFLMLGRAETMLTRGDLFTPADLKNRVFQKVSPSPLRDRIAVLEEGDGFPIARQVQLRDAAIDAGPVAQMLVDVDGVLLMANQQARALFDVGAADIGRRFQDLEISYRPIELRSRIDAAYGERRPIQIPNVDRAYGNGDIQCFDVTVAPVFESSGEPLGVTLSFTEVTRYRRLRLELERSNQELETAYEELQSTNEELETTNEELQSTVEELETTNEELQSSNEELETTNEELQSTNAEIQAMNDEMRQRTADLNRIVALTDGVLTSLDLALIVVDRTMRVQSWSEGSVELWGLQAPEVEGRPLDSLDFGLPVAELEPAIARCLRGEASRVSVTARNRRGQEFTCTVTVNPFIETDGSLQGVVLLLEIDKPA